MENVSSIKKSFFSWLTMLILFAFGQHFYFQNYLFSSILFLLTGSSYIPYKLLTRQLNTVEDILFDYRKNKQALLVKEKELQTLFDNNHAYLWTIDLNQQTFIASSGFESIFGYGRDMFLKNYELWLERTYPEDYPIALNHYLQLKKGHSSNQTWRFIHKNGSIRWIDAWGKPIFNSSNEVTQLTGVAYDITDRKKLEKQLKYQADHDFLTGLANRKYLYSSLNKKINFPDTPFALFFIDIDRFKFINDSFGHTAGDQILIDVADRIQTVLSSNDLAARVGGDEFILVVNHLTTDELTETIQTISDLFNDPFDLEKESRYVTASIGISLFPYHDTSIESLIRQADHAMYQAKKTGVSLGVIAQYQTVEMKDRDHIIEKDIQYAIKEKQFHLYFQPIVNLKTNEISGLEALIRWEHPDFGIISPQSFIPQAEKQGLIYSIGMWVLEESFCLFSPHSFNDLHLSVNISPIQLTNEKFLVDLDDLLNKYDIIPSKIIFEITEGFMENPNEAKKILAAIREKGIQIAIDDFGTGYSSLSVLSNIPFDILKMDLLFVKNMIRNQATQQLVKSIMQLAHTQNAKVIAEGIESSEQADFLLDINCLYGQGYLYGKPLPLKYWKEKLHL
ncbi:putative bifunctional diguanylate cyclase/phosphodiesterase [Lacticigenium naphthae]|uniref:putative bifunctional diguanylate cyclase/phosphodiesterase n=1 Tax=Lacticigenium naphthae TaxID=515351 RepID=UPI00041D5BD6|nr:GGDEF domain-containing phosphodiesterase [Lacticigenium naphthae]